jgi:hypothetical protein
MREVARLGFAVLLMNAILLVLALLCGVTPDSLLYGQWPDTDDHPTNWADTVLHP